MRLEKFLAESGVASRRTSKQIIVEGRVRVNGSITQFPGFHIDPEHDKVEVDEKVINLNSNAQKICIVLNKPMGVVSTANDTHGRPTVLNLVKDLKLRIYPIGRLDQDTEGLILLTNDGDLALKLTHPRYEVEKTYLVWVEGYLMDDKVEKLSKGVVFDGKKTAPAKVRILKRERSKTLIRITIHEGRKRQVRRMCVAVGHEVIHLKRIEFGPIKLGDLPRGKYKYLSQREIELLRQIGNRKLGPGDRMK